MEDAWQEQCRGKVEEILARRGWNLATDLVEFVSAVCDEAKAKFGDPTAPVPVSAIERATVHRYCLILYQACAEAGSLRQRRAFEELGEHLYRVALFKTHEPERAQDLTQEALASIWRNLEQCRDPGAFLSWCNLILLNVIRDYFRKWGTPVQTEAGERWVSREIRESELAARERPDEESEYTVAETPSEEPGFADAERAQLREQLIEALRNCLKSEAHQRAIVELFLNDKTIKEVADEWRTTPGNVQVMKSRALHSLRDCPDVIRLYEEWLK